MPTTNYSFPEFVGANSVDLMNVYNVAVQSIDTLIKAVTDTANANATDIDALQTAGDTTKKSLANLVTTTTANADAIKALQETDAQTTATLNEVKSKADSNTKALTTLQTSVTANTEGLSKAQEDISAQATTISTLQANVKNNSDDIASLKTTSETITPSTSDSALTVEGLANAKTMSNGIMYTGTDTTTEVSNG